MGQFFCHALRKGLIDTGIVTASRDIWGYNILIGFVLLSFFVLLCIDKYSLVWNDNPFHTVDGIYMSGAENLLDRDHVEETRYHESNDVTSEAYAVESFSRMDSKRIVQIKRRRAILLFFIMLVLVVIEGKVGVFRRFLAMVPWLVTHFDATKPFDPHIAFPAGDHNADWVPLFGSKRLSIHLESNQTIIERFFHRYGTRHMRCICTLRQYPLTFRLYACLLEYQL